MDDLSRPGSGPEAAAVRIRIKKIVYPGRSLGEIGGKIVFTDDGLPGELVEARPVREKASFLEAVTTSVIEPSPGRVPPRCGHYRACSPWQTIDHGLQLEIKGGQVREIFARELKIDPPAVPVIPSPLVWGYRNRARFHIVWEGAKAYAAYHEPGEETAFIRTDRCHLVPDEINVLLAAAVEALESAGARGVTDIEIRRSGLDGRLLMGAYIGPGADMSPVREAFRALGGRFPRAGAVGIVRQGRRTVEIPFVGKSQIEETAAGMRFRVGAQSFFQVNGGMLDAAVEEMRECCGIVRQCLDMLPATQGEDPVPKPKTLKPPKGDVARGMLLTDTDHKVQIATLDKNGKPVGVKDIEVSIYKIGWKWWWDQSEESLAQYASASETTALQTGKVSTTH